MIGTKSKSWFGRFAKHTAAISGHPSVCLAALLLIVIWAASGPFFKFNDTWQLVINTSTTIVTFLMVFLIQHTQNADSEAVQIKLDELIYVMAKTNNTLLDLEELDQEELDQIRARYLKIAKKARKTEQKNR